MEVAQLCLMLCSSEMVCSLLLVQTHPGLNMTVLCRVEPPFNVSAVTLECKQGPKIMHVRRSQGDNPDDQDPMFKGRTSLIPQGNRTFTVTVKDITKQDEGNYSCSLPEHGICSNVIPMKKSALSSDVITAIGVRGGVLLGGVLLGGVVVGILAFRYCRRNRNRTDPQPDSASIALRIMEEGESSQPPLDEGGVDPEPVSRPFIDDHLNQSHDGDVPDHYSEGGAEAAAGKRNDL